MTSFRSEFIDTMDDKPSLGLKYSERPSLYEAVSPKNLSPEKPPNLGLSQKSLFSNHLLPPLSSRHSV
jgi:hypothetical protein